MATHTFPISRQELPYPGFTSTDGKNQLARAKREVLSLDFTFLKQKARSSSADFAFFHSIAESIISDEKFRNVQTATLVADYLTGLLKEDTTRLVPPSLDATPRLWEAPVYALLNLFEVEFEKKSISSEICKGVVSALPTVIVLVLQDLNFLLHKTAAGDHRRCSISRLIFMVCQISSQLSALRQDDEAISLAMHSWLYMSPHSRYRRSAQLCVQYLLGSSRKYTLAPVDVIKRAVQSVSVETFIAQEKAVLGDATLSGTTLVAELKTIDIFTGLYSDVSQAFVDRRFYVDIIEALLRHAVNLDGKKYQEFAKADMDALSEGDRVINNILEKQTKSRPASQLLEDIIANTPMIRVAGAGFLAAALVMDYDDDWLSFLDRLHEVANPTIPPKNAWLYYPAGDLLNSTRNALRNVYHSIYTRMTTAYEFSVKYHGVWVRLGRDFQLEGKSELTRQFFRDQRRCCFILCPKAAWEIKDDIKKCSRCKDTFYCGKECQKLDWEKNHKPKCKRGGAAPKGRRDTDVMAPKRFVFPAED